MRVFGVDVGLKTCGYVLCELKGLQIDLIKEDQVIPDKKASLPQKLNYIFQELEKEVIQHKPEVIVAEKLYSHHCHPVTLGILAQVRGVVALLAEQRKINFFECSTTRARKSLLGRGGAKAFQVRKMAENLTGKKFKSDHTADAFSLVVAFSHAQKLKEILRGSLG